MPCAIAFHTPQGVILHSGDFKLDLQPVDGRRTDLSRMGELARTEGIRLLLSDSTNAEEPGFTESESTVGVTLRRVFASQAGKRIVVACFASHMHRVQQIIDAAVATGRKVATLGRSMGKNVELGTRLGIISIPDGMLVDIEDIDTVPPGEMCVISTGSQGEPMSALSLMATGDNKWLRIGEGDVVVISAHPIPGNEWSVGRVIDELHRRGAEVVHSGAEAVHVSGHARQGELRTLMSVTTPGVLRARARRVPPHGAPRPSGPLHGDRPGRRCCCARTATPSRSTQKGIAPRRQGAGRLRLRRRHGGRHRARGAARPPEAGRGRRGHGGGHRRPPARAP